VRDLASATVRIAGAGHSARRAGERREAASRHYKQQDRARFRSDRKRIPLALASVGSFRKAIWRQA